MVADVFLIFNVCIMEGKKDGYCKKREENRKEVTEHKENGGNPRGSDKGEKIRTLGEKKK